MVGLRSRAIRFLPRTARFAGGIACGLVLAMLAVSRPAHAGVRTQELAASPGSSIHVTPVTAFTRAVEAHRDELIEVRRDIHRHPEPSFHEERTAGIVASWLRDAGFEVTTAVGGHGVVGVLRGEGLGAAGTAPPDTPILVFRADMDAVRGSAEDPMEFRSIVPGVNHICGHDVHTAVGLALATGFSALRDRLPGTVVLVFQPAEEAAAGARAMLSDGIFDGGVTPAVDAGSGRAPDAIFAYHTVPLPVGEIMTRAGTLLPGRDRVRIEISGEGDLAAVASEVRTVVAGVATEGSTDPFRPSSENFVVVRGLRSNAAGPGVHVVGATLTTAGAEASRSAREALERRLAALRRPGTELRLDYEEGWIEGAKNDPALVRRSMTVARTVLGEAAVREAQTTTTIFSEDFGSFQSRVPGVMYFLGVSNPDRGWVGMPHSPTYAADEEAIFIGAKAMAAVFLDLFERRVPRSARP